MSASHAAMSSLRMESTYAVIGEAAGVAASHARLSRAESVQEVDVKAICADLSNAGVVTKWNGKGYGPYIKKPWSADTVHWESHPEEYNKIPICLGPSWEDFCSSVDGSGDTGVESFASLEDWNSKKPAYNICIAKTKTIARPSEERRTPARKNRSIKSRRENPVLSSRP